MTADPGAVTRALIDAERARQVEVEGWTHDHDAEHGQAKLLRAAEAYEFNESRFWPWDWEWWKPKGALRNLVRAGALYQAALDVDGDTLAAANGRARCEQKAALLLTEAAEVLASLPDDRLAEAEAKVRRVEAKLEEWGHDPECESLTCLKGDGSTREPADCDCYYAEFRAALSGGDAT